MFDTARNHPIKTVITTISTVVLVVGVLAMINDVQSSWSLTAPLGMIVLWFTTLGRLGDSL